MSRGPSSFKKTDVTRATRAVLSAGLSVERIEIEKGRIVVVPGSPGKAQNGSEPNPWDGVLANATEQKRAS